MLFLAAAAVLFGAVLIPFGSSVHKENEFHRHPTYLFGFEKSVRWMLARRLLKSILTCIEKYFVLLIFFFFKFRRLESSGFSNSMCPPDVLGLRAC